MAALLREQRAQVLEGFELERIARWVEKKHGRLFADLTFEPDMRLYDESGVRGSQPVSKRMPFGHPQNHAKVPYRNLIPINSAGTRGAGLVGRKMCNDLMAVEIEVDPFRTTAPFRAAEQATIKRARCTQVMNGKGQMKRLHSRIPSIRVE